MKANKEAEGEKVYNFSVGTPDFKPADYIMEAVSKAAMEPENYKYSLKDIPQLIDAVKARFKTRYHVDVNADEITSLYGSQEGFTHIALKEKI